MKKEPEFQKEAKEPRNPLSSVIVTGVGVFSVLVLLFPSILPDFIPIVGALDEAAATALLISCLAYYGVDIGSVFGRKKKKSEADSDVIDAEFTEK